MTDSIVYVVDDDDAVRDSLTLLLRSIGLKAAAFAGPDEFLEAVPASARGCAIVDMRMPTMSGLQLFEAMQARAIHLPVIFITGHGDVPMAVQAMRAGAFDFIQKPFREDELIQRVQVAVQQDAQTHESQQEFDAMRERLQTLTPREREILQHMLNGEANKVMAIELGISQRTVELHRARVMQKLHARSLARLIRAVLPHLDELE